MDVGILQAAERLAIYLWLSNFLIKCSEQKSCPIMELNMFHTLNRAMSNKTKCYLNENFSLSCYHAACSSNFLQTFRNNLSVHLNGSVISYRRFATTFDDATDR